MKEFMQLMRRFLSPYRKFIVGAVFLNILSAVFNIFSFTLLIPILQILFEMDNTVYEFIPWDAEIGLKDKAINNVYYDVKDLIGTYGPSLTLLILGVFLAIMTLLKTSCYFGSSAIMIPLLNGVVREILVLWDRKLLSVLLCVF